MDMIKTLRIKKGITQKELADLCGVHQTAVSQWENGRTLPDKQTLLLLSDIFNVSLDLLMGKGETAKQKYLIPVFDRIRANEPTDTAENTVDHEDVQPHISLSGEYFGLKVHGDSMTPRICPNDTVIVHRQEQVENGELAVVLIGSLDATVKKVIKKGTSLTLVPFNTDYEPLIFTPAESVSLPVRIVGKVVELRGKF